MCQFMFTISLIFLFSLVFNINWSEANRRVRRIVNGDLVEIDTQRRVASLRLASDQTHQCVATILSPRVAVTAAHCLRSDNQYTLHLNNDSLKRVVPVVDFIIHPQYDILTRAHDIALLKIITEEEGILADWLAEDVLPAHSFGASGVCVTYGYGAWQHNSGASREELFSAGLQLLTLDECERRLGDLVAPAPDAGLLCAVGIDAADTCQGDSGAPVLCGGVMEALSSHGIGCGVEGLPAVYTSVGCHNDWIKSYLN